MASNALLQTVYDSFIGKSTIKELPVTERDIALVTEKATEPSSFDGDNFRLLSGGLKKYLLGGGSTLYVKGVAPMETIRDMSAVLATAEHPYSVFWFAHSGRRLFPAAGRPVEAKHINGGYCMACQPDTIVIYRAEDALRVLIHEMQHASCLDNYKHSLPVIEAECEAWAEIFYSMFMARKHRLSVEDAWQIQLAWALGQNRRLQSKHRVLMPTDYAWRYTIGKENVWRKYGLLWDVVPMNPNSLSLGVPEQLFSDNADESG
jgi:hypothetical protein